MNLKRFIGVIFSVALILSCLMFAFACGNRNDSQSDSGSTPEPQPASLTLADGSIDLLFGESYMLSATYTGQSGVSLVWESQNPAVATVSDGLVTATGKGSTKIIATYGEKTAECEVNVNFGNYMPELKVKHITDDSVRLSLNSQFSLDAYVAFNGKNYPCEYAVEVENADMVSYADGTLTANRIGTTSVKVKTNWNSFDNALTEKTFDVEVFNDVSINAIITVDGDSYASNALQLSVTPRFAGEEYATSANVKFVVNENGTKTTINGTLVSGDSAVEFENGLVTVAGIGNALIRAEYTDSLGNPYTCELNVEVIVPVAEYNEKFEFCTENAFPLNDLFGEGAEIISAASEGKELTVTENVIGLVAKGENTPAFEVKTTKGGYVFKNVYAYTRKITSANFSATFNLKNDVILDGYYVLTEDVTGVNAASQLSGSKTTYFKGVLDGCGHTITATAGPNGLFGALAGGAVIKNAKFVLTFPEGRACGFAKNNGTFNQNDAENHSLATLENLSIVTTNYYAESTVIMDQKPDKLHMTDVYVKINGNAALGEYTEATSLRRALFFHDQALNDGVYDQFNGGTIRVYVVTETFIPIANGLNWKGINFVTYAYNDTEKLGSFTRENTSNGAFNYNKIFNANDETDAKSKFFSAGKYTYLYGAHFNYKDGGIARFDTVNELIESGVTQVGSWTVE